MSDYKASTTGGQLPKLGFDCRAFLAQPTRKRSLELLP